MKKYFRNLAAKIVTWYYRRMYEKGVQACDKLHKEKKILLMLE